MNKTAEELAQQYISTIADTHSVKAACEKAFIAGYKAGNDRKFRDVVRDNYNERKLEEVTNQVENLKERIRTLCKANDQIRSIAVVVDEQRTSWQLSDNEFETHGKLGPYAGLFGRKNENT